MVLSLVVLGGIVMVAVGVLWAGYCLRQPACLSCWHRWEHHQESGRCAKECGCSGWQE